MYACSTDIQVHKMATATAITTNNNINIPPATSNWFVMGLESMNVIQIGLPVLDKSPVVCGRHPHAVVAPRYTADRTVMALQIEHRETI